MPKPRPHPNDAKWDSCIAALGRLADTFRAGGMPAVEAAFRVTRVPARPRPAVELPRWRLTELFWRPPYAAHDRVRHCRVQPNHALRRRLTPSSARTAGGGASRRAKQTTPQAGGGSAPGGSVTIDVTVLLALATWCRQRLDDPAGGAACPTPPDDAPHPPPRLTSTAAPATEPPVWAHLPADRQKQLHELLGQLLARLHAARSRKEAGHE